MDKNKCPKSENPDFFFKKSQKKQKKQTLPKIFKIKSPSYFMQLAETESGGRQRRSQSRGHNPRSQSWDACLFVNKTK